MKTRVIKFSFVTGDDEKITITGKGGPKRTAMLYAAPDSLRLLRKYLHLTKIQSGAIFRGDPRKGGSSKPMTYQGAQFLWNKYCRIAGIKANIHQLRHSRATTMVNGGVDLGVVRKVLGHRNMQTTLRYAQINDQTVKRALMTFARR